MKRWTVRALLLLGLIAVSANAQTTESSPETPAPSAAPRKVLWLKDAPHSESLLRESLLSESSPDADEEAAPRARLGTPQAASEEQPADAASKSKAADGTAPCCLDHCDGCPYPPGRVWFSAEYLLWCTRGDRLPPLLTTSPAGTPLADAGVLGRPGTTVLFGDERVNDDARSGARFTLGSWLTSSHKTGVEANYFFLGRETTQFSAASPGTPILARPFFDVLEGENNSLKVAYPGLVAGDFQARVTSELWGADVYLRHNVYCGCCCRIDVLGGYRFASLEDDLDISETEIGTNPQNPLAGIPIFINEGFNTRNRFHGGQFGFIAEYARCRTFVRLIGKFALGANCRTAVINGATRVNGFDPETGGFLALPSNIGRYRSSDFAVLPEIGLTVGYQLTNHLRVMGGYTLLYWDHLSRPGDQIDLRVNTSQPPLGGGLVGPARPAFAFGDSDFWAQGLSVGFELRY